MQHETTAGCTASLPRSFLPAALIWLLLPPWLSHRWGGLLAAQWPQSLVGLV